MGATVLPPACGGGVQATGRRPRPGLRDCVPPFAAVRVDDDGKTADGGDPGDRLVDVLGRRAVDPDGDDPRCPVDDGDRVLDRDAAPDVPAVGAREGTDAAAPGVSARRPTIAAASSSSGIVSTASTSAPVAARIARRSRWKSRSGPRSARSGRGTRSRPRASRRTDRRTQRRTVTPRPRRPRPCARRQSAVSPRPPARRSDA